MNRSIEWKDYTILFFDISISNFHRDSLIDHFKLNDRLLCDIALLPMPSFASYYSILVLLNGMARESMNGLGMIGLLWFAMQEKQQLYNDEEEEKPIVMRV